MLNSVVFDDGCPELGVLTDLRPVFLVRTGRVTTLERIERTLGRQADAVFVPADLASLTAKAHTAPVNTLPNSDDLLLINGRCVLPPADLDSLEPNSALMEPGADDRPIAVRLNQQDAADFLKTFELPATVIRREVASPCLLRRPWDVIRHRNTAIASDLESLTSEPINSAPAGVTTIGDSPIHIHPSATLLPSVILDATIGPIVIDESATIRPGAIIVGPACIGARSTILEHALIKANTVVGPSCKIAGEVGGTIIQGFSNKAHDGHLGDAWLGEWVNLGAGTMNSNLLNTYGEVRAIAKPGSPREKTGLTFLGSILGDHVKTAIGTRLMTGSIIGTGAMIASSAPPPVSIDRFAWFTDGGHSLYQLDRFLEVAQRMMSRRDIELTEPMRRRLSQLHASTPG